MQMHLRSLPVGFMLNEIEHVRDETARMCVALGVGVGKGRTHGQNFDSCSFPFRFTPLEEIVSPSPLSNVMMISQIWRWQVHVQVQVLISQLDGRNKNLPCLWSCWPSRATMPRTNQTSETLHYTHSLLTLTSRPVPPLLPPPRPLLVSPASQRATRALGWLVS